LTRSRALDLYVILIGLLATGVLVAAGVLTWQVPHQEVVRLLPLACVLAMLGWLGSRRVVYFTASSTIALGSIAQIAAIILLPYPMAILAIGLAKIPSQLAHVIGPRADRRLRQMIVNVGGIVLANALGGAAFHVMHGSQDLWARDAKVVIAFGALAALALVYYATDLFVVATAISLSRRDGPWTVVKDISRGTILPEMSLILVGVIFAVIVHFSPLLSVFIVVPVVFSVRAFESVARLRKETMEAVLKMAESIDYRDTGTYEHSRRLADLSAKLCRTVGITPEHTEQVVLASRVHDLGKIGISNDILLKQGPLSPEERHLMQEHPLIGANILSSYSAFRASVDIVRHHHERWDGGGYPDGLRAEHIPLGSRIITVVDAFDSMTADRPYRMGMSIVEAVERLKAGMGSQFDPRICAAFIQILIEDGSYIPSDTVATLHILSREAVG
jgi:HD-GYP domain-containing protein (c-di-GMP phosphodiesterase class II)